MDRTTKFLQTLLRLTQDLRKINPLLLLGLGLIPLCLVLWRLEEHSIKLQAWTDQIDLLEERAISSKNLQTNRESLWERVQKSNPHYLTQVVEPLPLLAPELRRVQALARQYPANNALQERLSFLQGDKNRIHFVEQTQRAGSFFQETELKMQSSVQMNEEDLRKFLTAIEEDQNQDRPLLLVKEFELKRIKEKADEIVYDIQVELIKRSP
ncbi:MAG TPA: hypothetical protein VMR37_01835 [Rhabdochlamydiaceae bacterium]|jgi:hypothetical protein|nr:hypothetical protein [Rhabdochlamydiaceae bacterium]